MGPGNFLLLQLWCIQSHGGAGVGLFRILYCLFHLCSCPHCLTLQPCVVRHHLLSSLLCRYVSYLISQSAACPSRIMLTACISLWLQGTNVLTLQYGLAGLSSLLQQPCPTLLPPPPPPPSGGGAPTTATSPPASVSAVSGHAGWGARQASVAKGRLDVARVVDLIAGAWESLFGCFSTSIQGQGH